MRGHSEIDGKGRGHTGYQYEPRDFEDFDMLNLLGEKYNASTLMNFATELA